MSENEEKKRKRLPASERKKVILDAALDTFVEFGYHGALMDTIAERAEVTKPILYRHFPSKRDLLLAIVDRAGEELLDSLAQPEPQEMDWLTAIKHSIHSYFDFVVRAEADFRLIYATDVNVDSEAYERVTQIRKGITSIVEENVRSYTDTSLVPPEDIAAVAVLLVGMVESTVIYWMNNKEISNQVYEENLVRAAASILAQLPPRVRPAGG
jgi:AcrR family transcriptional regulator